MTQYYSDKFERSRGHRAIPGDLPTILNKFPTRVEVGLGERLTGDDGGGTVGPGFGKEPSATLLFV